MAKTELDLYLVDKKYIRDLSNADDNVLSVSPQINKNERPFVGIVMVLDEKEYCVPLTSPKDKFEGKSKIDFIKIPDPKLKNSNGSPVTIGILNINNMIPISRQYISKIDLSESSDIDKKRRILLQKEIHWCRKNLSVIQNRANKVYKAVTEAPDKNKNLIRRCCDFRKLEAILEKHISKENNG
ncbi:MAG: type III toxin-antitoxin system ToxN/AbiQ family toxin [Oscillospiraceae bacterium]|nr:type III toxin-antitoxin system ToxN/AbiQ family toxin [Oscillospiraceae bacterium]